MGIPRPLCLDCSEAQENALYERYQELIKKAEEDAAASITAGCRAGLENFPGEPWTKEMQDVVNAGTKTLVETVAALEKERDEKLKAMREKGGYEILWMVEDQAV